MWSQLQMRQILTPSTALRLHQFQCTAHISVSVDGKTPTAIDKGYQNEEEIQGQTRQHSRSNTPLVMKPTNNDVNMSECDSTEQEQERYDETSRDLKSVLIMSQYPNTVLFLNERCVAHSQNAELWTLCNNFEGSPYPIKSLFPGRTCCVTMMILPTTDQSLSLSLCYWMWQDQVTHQFKKNYDFDSCIFTIPTEVNGKNTTEPEHKEFEENYMTVYVKTISGKTIRIRCDKKQ